MALSLSQLEQADIQAGWPTQLVPTAAAIEEAESSGNPSAIGPSYGGDTGSWGLFQIQPSAHPGVSQTADPVQQSKDALAIYQAAGGFGPWSTYTEGSYKQFLGQAQAAMSGVDTSGAAARSSDGTSSSDGSSSAAAGASALWGSFSSTLGKTLGEGVNVAQMGLGALAIAGGLLFLFLTTDTGKRVAAGVKRGVKDAAKVAAMAA